MIQADADRWEYGSIFHWFPYEPQQDSVHPWGDDCAYFGCGRDALCGLLYHGLETRGWRRLWVPTFFCQDVVQSFIDTGIEVRAYPYCAEDESPRFDRIQFRQGDVLLRINFFGLHSSLPLDGVDRSVVEIVDDHTHDPWSDMAWQSDADWCMTSLRKVLPIPDGGVLWSPKGYELPDEPEVTETRRLASLEKIAAMTLKALYLNGLPFSRDIYRRLSVAAESNINDSRISGMPEWTKDLLGCFPVNEWRAKRRSNFKALSEALEGIPWLKVLQPDDDRACPFAGILVFDCPGRRNHVQQSLIERRVFLSVMWPLDSPAIEGIPEEHADFSRRILCAPCDVRYGTEELLKVAGLIREVGEAYQVRTEVVCVGNPGAH
ncbi:MAG TPA: hypothetical protein VFI02_15910 [Armatimonadota bacterium]|nr:hypothetical protein [Armatimonadota bacterium]